MIVKTFMKNPRCTSNDFIAGWNAAMSAVEMSGGIAKNPVPIDVIFNPPATIVFFSDNSKSVVKCQPGDVFDNEKGLMAALLKRYMGNDNTFNKVINALLPDDELVVGILPPAEKHECCECENCDCSKSESAQEE